MQQLEAKRQLSNQQLSAQLLLHTKSSLYEKKPEALLRALIQKIANRYFFALEDPLRAKEYVHLDQILSGTVSMRDLNAFYQRRRYIPDLPPLPLSAQETKVLKYIFKILPITTQNITLMDVLGLTIHSKFVVLSTSDMRVTQLKNYFFRLWNSAVVIQYYIANLQIKQDAGFTQSCKTCLQMLHTIQDEHPHLDAQTQKHFHDLEQAITILVRLWDCEDAVQFLHSYHCDQIKALNPLLPKENQSAKEQYQGMQSFADYMICAFENTPYPQMRENKLSNILENFKFAYDFIYPRQHRQPASFVSQEITQTQKRLVQSAYRVVENHARQKGEAMGRIKRIVDRMKRPPSKCARLTSIVKRCLSPVGSFLRKLPEYVGVRLKKPVVKATCFPSQYDHMQCVTSVFHYIAFCQALNHLILLLEQYAKASFPMHETLQVQLIRIDILNKLCCQHIETAQAPNQEHMLESEVLDFLNKHCPEKDVFPAEMQPILTALCLEIAKDVEGLFTVNRNLMEYVQYKKMGLNTVEDNIDIVYEYGLMYPHYKLLIECIYQTLNNLQKAHSQKLMQFIEQLPLEFCVTHQEKILTFFENFLLNCTKHICILALLNQNLGQLLLKEGQQGSISFLDPILLYLLMKEFEEAFLNKIAKAAPVVVAPPTPAPAPVFLESGCVELNMVRQTKVKKSASTHQKQEKEKKSAPVSEATQATEQVEQPTSPVRDALYLRKGLKIDKIIRMLNDYGYKETDQSGSHVSFEHKDDHSKVIIPIHKQKPYLSGPVRRDVMERVNYLLR